MSFAPEGTSSSPFVPTKESPPTTKVPRQLVRSIAPASQPPSVGRGAPRASTPSSFAFTLQFCGGTMSSTELGLAVTATVCRTSPRVPTGKLPSAPRPSVRSLPPESVGWSSSHSALSPSSTLKPFESMSPGAASLQASPP